MMHAPVHLAPAPRWFRILLRSVSGPFAESQDKRVSLLWSDSGTYVALIRVAFGRRGPGDGVDVGRWGVSAAAPITDSTFSGARRRRQGRLSDLDPSSGRGFGLSDVVRGREAGVGNTGRAPTHFTDGIGSVTERRLSGVGRRQTTSVLVEGVLFACRARSRTSSLALGSPCCGPQSAVTPVFGDSCPEGPSAERAGSRAAASGVGTIPPAGQPSGRGAPLSGPG